MNLFAREMRRNRTSFLIWITAMIAVNAMVMASFPSVAEMAKNTEAMLSQYPEEFVRAMNLDVLKMTNVLHFYASRSFLLSTIMGSVYAIMLSSCILSKEENDHTIEFLLSKPLSRVSIVSSKTFSVLMYVTAFDVSFSAVNLVILNHFKLEDFSMKGFLLVSLGAWLIHLVFAFLGLTISATIPRTRTDISVGLGIVFVGYFLSIVASLSDKLSFTKYLTPFSYFNTKDLVVNTTIEPLYLAITVIVCASAMVFTYLYYKRKDIAA